MKQSTRATNKQLALWSVPRDQVQPLEETREEVTRLLADLLLEALGVKLPTSQTGGDDESEDLA
jgi:hypothetical protein